MSSPRIIHEKLQEISSKYISGRAPINISSIAEELGINKDKVVEDIAVLKTLDLVEFIDGSREVIILTDSGRMSGI